MQEAQFEATCGLAALPFLDDHRIYGAAVLPTVAGLEIAMAGGISLLSSREIELKNVVYREALVVPEEGARIVQTIFTPQGEGTFVFQILSIGADGQRPLVLPYGRHLDREDARGRSGIVPRNPGSPGPSNAGDPGGSLLSIDRSSRTELRGLVPWHPKPMARRW